MNILGIETSCDETAAAVVKDGTEIISNPIASQVDIHAQYGGIVPEVASRQHLITAIPIIEKAMADARLSLSQLDGIAVTIGPGLAGSLLVGVNIAKAIALARGLPLIGVNHLEGHIYANWLAGDLARTEETTAFHPAFPSVCLIVSGGHTDLVLMRGHGDYLMLGQTRDDAAGEAFDKAARILGLGYPGGPIIEKVAQSGEASSFPLPRAWLKGSDDFSFSGVKTALLRLVEEKVSPGTEHGKRDAASTLSVASAAASFQEAVVDVLVTKTIEAAKRHQAACILLGGGVAANRLLRERIIQHAPMPVLFPAPILCTDNAAMIASCGYYRFRAGKVNGWDLDVIPGLRLA